MGRKKNDDPPVFSFEDIPKKYLSAPVSDDYQPELAELYRKRRSKPGFENLKMNSASEKFYRLYFYQGVSQPDRTLLHQMFLETQSRRYKCTGAVIASSVGVYAYLGTTVKYSPFKLIRLILSGLGGYATYKMYKNYSTYKLEQECDPYFEKYAIR